MNFNNPIYPTYQPNNYQNWNLQRTEIIKVNGKNGVDAYQMAPNSSALLLDTSNPLVWLVQTDGAGYKTCTPYTITLYQPQPPVSVNDLEQRIRRLEDIINAKSDGGTTEQPENTGSNKPA